ncbi:MAG: endonuclease/exonuclease/phosphatase family protein [Nitriliruptorales bacterium]
MRSATWRPALTGALAEFALPALTVTFASQLLRLMVSTVVSVQRERLGMPLAGLGAFGLGVPLLGLLAPLVVARVGPRRALWLSAGGTSLVRLALQLVPDALARWFLTPIGVVSFLWSVPLLLGSSRRHLGPALMAGLALDAALFGLWGTWDYAWRTDVGSFALAAGLVALQLAALRRVRVSDQARTTAAVAAAPLVGLGPALFLFFLVWQNIAWQTVFGRQSQLTAFALVMAANVAAILAAAWTGSAGGLVLGVVAETGVLVAAFLAARQATLSLLLGLVAAAVLLSMICWRAGHEDRRGLPIAPAVAWTLGMEGFFALLFLYYASYDVVLPYDNQSLLLVAAAVLAGAGIAAQLGAGRRADRPVARLPAALVVVLLVAPLGAWPPRPRAGDPDGFPVRVMSYNLHFGFDPSGWSDLEAVARDVEAGEAEVVGLQEVNRGWYVNGGSDMLAWLARRLRMPYAAFGPASDSLWGNAILSRYPITASVTVPLPNEGVPLRRSYLWARIDLGRGQALQVIDTHLHQVPGPEGERIRLGQVDRLLQAWGGGSVTVLMGDLNAEPTSPVVARLQAAGLKDAWRIGGGSRADELTVPSVDPSARIDYIWCSPDLAAGDFRATSSTASDHRGVVVTVSR